MHHIIADMWSMGVFVRELSALYDAFVQDKPSPLAPLAIQYADFAHWQRQWLGGAVLDQQLAYWKQQLAGAPTLLELPLDLPRPPVQRFDGARLPVALSADCIAAIQALSQQTGASLFMVLLAAFAVLLSRYSGQDDVVIGSPIANRTHSQTEALIGFFVNTLVLRADLSGDITFADLLQRVRATAIDAYSHQDIPFERLVEDLQPQRNLSYSPLFQVMFALRNVPVEKLSLSGLKLAPLEREGVVAKFDLMLELNEDAKGIHGFLEYNTALFTPATMTRMAAHWQQLLQTLVTQPQTRLHEISLLTVAEQQQQQRWNDTRQDYPQHDPLMLFEAQVERTPRAPALRFGDKTLTYRELNARANQLAHFLKARGVGPETLVALCVERCIEMVVALLAILKAGGAYLPLDPAYPTTRLAFILEDARITLLLTQYALREQVPAGQAEVICLDVEAEAFAQLPASNPVSTATPDNLAYVIYTSGSTGNPKGVQIQRAALANFLHAMRQTTGISADDRLLAVTTLAFDIAALEIYLPLVTGATTVLLPREQASDGTRLLTALAQENICRAGPYPSAGWRN